MRRAALRHAAVRVGAALALVCVTGACTAATDAPLPTVESVRLQPGDTTLAAGATLVLRASAADAAGAPVTGRTTTWSSSTPAVASVTANGVVTAVAPGTATIAASIAGRSATARLTVEAPTVASVLVQPAVLTLRRGTQAALVAEVRDADGALLVGRAVQWTSSDPGIATVTATGVLTGVAVGATTVEASVDGRRAQVAVTVTPVPIASVAVAPDSDTLAVGTVRAFTATVRDADGVRVDGRSVSWSTADPGVATIASDGTATALAPGETTVAAVVDGQVGTASLVVRTQLASTVIVVPGVATLVAGDTVRLEARVTGADGTLLQGRPLAFASSDPGIVTVDGTGLVTAVGPGTATVSVTSEGKVGTARLDVVPVPVARVDITPAAAVLDTGATRVLVATPRDAAGAPLGGRAVVWRSGAPAVATVDAAGVVRGVGAGVAIVLATVDGVTGTASITVRPPPVARVDIVPANPAVNPGQALQLQAVARDAAGVPLFGRPVTWTSDDESVAFISTTGRLVGVAAGSVRISATVEGTRGSTIVTVR